MLFRFNRLTLLANIFSLQFTEISEYQPSSSYRASKSRLFPYIHCKFCRVCPTTKIASATVKPSILAWWQKERKLIIVMHKTSWYVSRFLDAYTLGYKRNLFLQVVVFSQCYCIWFLRHMQSGSIFVNLLLASIFSLIYRRFYCRWIVLQS